MSSKRKATEESVTSGDSNKKMCGSSSSKEKNGAPPSQSSKKVVGDDLLSLMKEMSPNVKEAIYGWYKELCQVHLVERLLKFYRGDGSWWEEKTEYSGPLPDGVRDNIDKICKKVHPCDEYDTPNVYTIVIDDGSDGDLDDLEVLLVTIRYGEHGGDGYMNAFYDSKTFRPLLLHDEQYCGKVFTDFQIPMEQFVERQRRIVEVEFSEF